MVKPTLLVLAAGMGSRYGSLKQMDGVGPNNEAIIDYSVYDAIRAGFGKVVFVIRHSFEKEFREVFSAERFGGRIAVEFVFQELDYLPEGASVPEGRVKPWGTNHAVMMAADAVHEPFAVINADDFYGAEAYQTIGDYLSQLGDSKNRYCMVAYDLNRTLSDNGTVSRGVCGVDADGNLILFQAHIWFLKCQKFSQKMFQTVRQIHVGFLNILQHRIQSLKFHKICHNALPCCPFPAAFIPIQYKAFQCTVIIHFCQCNLNLVLNHLYLKRYPFFYQLHNFHFNRRRYLLQNFIRALLIHT